MNKLENKIDHKKFIQELKNEFPLLVDELNDHIWKGLLHLEMAVFARYVQRLVDEHNYNETKKCFFFINRISKDCTDDVDNAIGVSFFEHLDLENTNQWAYEEILTREQKEIYEILHGKS